MKHSILWIGILLMMTSTSVAQKGLSKKEAEALSVKEWAQEKQRLLPAAQKVWAEGIIKFGKYTMPIAYRTFGEKPADGRSLYISLHGGGNAPPAVNNQQWENQRTLYPISEGLVIVPRAPTDTWNLWHEDHIDNLLDSLICYGVILEDVNPNKVYILGYSAGGDGVFQLGPRMADRWAAASMMAGHPGDANALNLRNLPFAIYMGGRDTAYHRNTLAIDFNRKLDSLQRLDPKGFIHDFHLYADKAHWMDRRDTVAIPWLASFKRNPFPEKVIWVEDNVVQHRFYWLSAPAVAQVKGSTAEISIRGNEICVSKNTFRELNINLNDQLLDLDKPVSVTMNGRVVFRKKVKRSLETIRKTIREYQDPTMVFSVKLILTGNKVRT
ncbi:alpha/beta hydrolase [Sphingobacterium olei]|uniref:Alpha/beta hydrolase n=1 Tax=Sphingobacterium olei TaxID=2571155 RepID=A0A4U0P2E8_9SPHI|nr:alpha/beta hydrolase [Sphingobacterium olei]TJZ61280.1 alpha/beta hydrolase [Sphingobacterium olei]